MRPVVFVAVAAVLLGFAGSVAAELEGGAALLVHSTSKSLLRGALSTPRGLGVQRSLLATAASTSPKHQSPSPKTKSPSSTTKSPSPTTKSLSPKLRSPSPSPSPWVDPWPFHYPSPHPSPKPCGIHPIPQQEVVHVVVIVEPKILYSWGITRDLVAKHCGLKASKFTGPAGQLPIPRPGHTHFTWRMEYPVEGFVVCPKTEAQYKANAALIAALKVKLGPSSSKPTYGGILKYQVW